MGRALGMDEELTELRLIKSDAGDWTVVPRVRVLLSTLPHLPGPQLPSRASPWAHSWGPRREDKMPPMMRSRGQWVTEEGEVRP
eukprot:11160139-Lingulodinium_polyedra.AAC.1